MINVEAHAAYLLSDGKHKENDMVLRGAIASRTKHICQVPVGFSVHQVLPGGI